ncbi:MAG: fused MFS/spermidine synthase [Bryobacteraceae bacterium]|nr:fused MFS/spermidine synthase [Bryobacteraceae bacterium]
MADLFDDYDQPSQTSTPFLRQGKRKLSLHFNIFGVQSEMDIRWPDQLVLGYTRTMMGFLLFTPQPRHIGMIGLGGGSLQKHCYRYLPDAQISVAEISHDVIALRDRFCIPDDDHRFHVYCEDGADFVESYQNQFDVMIVDGFDAIGQPSQLCSQAFYDACSKALTQNGILVVNVYDGRNSVLISRVRQSFQNRVVSVGGQDSNNAIVFACKGNLLGKSTRDLKISAERIEKAAALHASWETGE